ncbi:MAG: rane protein of unknown function [Pseudoduganella sp.]|jgi:hypothetical protein|nr:rane protein of unknown function [Pseudoduganella sp.]
MRRDWALLAIGALFVLASLLNVPREGAKALATLPFFAAIAGVGAWNILRKKRAGRLREARVQVADGVLLRPSRWRLAGLAALLLAIGLPIVVFGAHFGVVMKALGAFVALAGAILLGAVALGWLPAGYLQFSPSGLTFGFRGYAACVPWSEVAGVATGEFHDNAFVGIGIYDLDKVMLTPPHAAARFARTVGKCRAYYHADLAVMAGAYRIDAPVLAAAIADRLPRR